MYAKDNKRKNASCFDLKEKKLHHYKNEQVENYKKSTELVKNSAEDYDKFTKTYMPAFNFFPFCFFIICPVRNSST